MQTAGPIDAEPAAAPDLPSPRDRARDAVLTVLDLADEFRADPSTLQFIADLTAQVLTGIRERLPPSPTAA